MLFAGLVSTANHSRFSFQPMRRDAVKPDKQK